MNMMGTFKKMLRRTNITLLLYILLNTAIITGVTSAVFGNGTISDLEAAFYGIVIYGVIVAIMLSPIGEFYFRISTGCRIITKTEYIDSIEPVFREVYDRAKLVDPTLPNNIRLFVSREKGLNAFAIGRKTICVTKELLNVPEDQIKAVLAHEFGHLSHKDTSLSAVMYIGEKIIGMMVIIFTLIANVIHILALFTGAIFGKTMFFIIEIFCKMVHIVIDILLWITIKIWKFISKLLVQKSSRANEFEADKFAFELGYGKELCDFFGGMGDDGFIGFLQILVSSHPATADRIERLQQLEDGCVE